MVPCDPVVNARLCSYTFYYKLLCIPDYASLGPLIAPRNRIAGVGGHCQRR